MDKRREVAITGIGLQIPGVDGLDVLAQLSEDQCVSGEFDPRAMLGRKGLRFKDRATKLALCAGLTALENAGLADESGRYSETETFGAVVSSNLGNLDTVGKVVETIRAGSVRDTSVMDLPNASSNVIATSVAIRFGLRGLNVMLCNGATSGLDALYLAANSIRAGRAERMLVIGVEVDNPFVSQLIAESRLGGDTKPLDGACAIVLENAALANAREAEISGYIGEYVHHAVEGANDSWSRAYGMQGVMQAALATLHLAQSDESETFISAGGSWGDDAAGTLCIRAAAA
jgi:3-oxoacyl-[acyl-carrier-protein] synthase II